MKNIERNKKRSVGTNVALNIVKSISQLFLPLITYPYLLRILGADNIGKVSYGSAIISYFSLFAVLGTNIYAVRESSKIRDNKDKINEFASQIFLINIFFTVLSYFFLFLLVTFDAGVHEYALLLLIQSVAIISSAISLEWINSVFEDYLFITIRSVIINLIQIFLIFIFVHKKTDYYWYAGIQTLAIFLVAFMNWIYCRKYISLRIPQRIDFFKHVKPLIILFSNNIAVQIYMNIDTVMLGRMTSNQCVGLYAAATKIYSLIKNILASVYIVPLSRMTYYYAHGKKKEFKLLYTNVVSFLTIIIIPAATGMFVLSKGLMYLLGGAEYLDAEITLKILSVSLVFALYGGIITQCYNIVVSKEKINLQATTLSAMIDFLLNIFMINQFTFNGAAFTTLLAEAFVLLYCFVRIDNKKELFLWKDIMSSGIHAIIGSISIVIISYIFRFCFDNLVVYTLTVCLFSVIVYFIELILLKDKIFINVLSRFGIYKKKII